MLTATPAAADGFGFDASEVASTRTSWPSTLSASISAVTKVSDSSGKRSVATTIRNSLRRREALDPLGLRLPFSARLDVAGRAHEVERPALHLVVDAAHVLADDPDRDELDAAEQQHHAQHRREAGDRLAREPQPDHERDREQRHERDQEAEHRRELERPPRERRDRIE